MNVSVDYTIMPDGSLIKHPNKSMKVLKPEDRPPIKDSQFNKISKNLTKYVNRLYKVR